MSKCKQCGKAVDQVQGKRKREFCVGDACRKAYSRANTGQAITDKPLQDINSGQGVTATPDPSHHGPEFPTDLSGTDLHRLAHDHAHRQEAAANQGQLGPWIEPGLLKDQ